MTLPQHPFYMIVLCCTSLQLLYILYDSSLYGITVLRLYFSSFPEHSLMLLREGNPTLLQIIQTKESMDLSQTSPLEDRQSSLSIV